LIGELSFNNFIAGTFDCVGFLFRKITGRGIGQTAGFFNQSQTFDEMGTYFYAADGKIIYCPLCMNSPVSVSRDFQ